MRQWRSFFAGVMTTLILVSLIGSAIATANRQEQATLNYSGIKIILNGTEVIPKDASGNTIEPFAINGTTYLPVRGIANALGLDVAWDQATQTVKLSSTSNNPAQSTPAPSTPAPSSGATTGEKNALSKAQQYLRVSAFSYTGLISQLEYEGFTTSEATYGADHCGADWNEQAAKKAEQYLKIMSFSRQGLIDQLKYEGFTDAQAEYGAAAVGY